MLNVFKEPTQDPLPTVSPAVLALGFRPFFLGAAIAAVVLILQWLLMWSGALPPSRYYGLINWHGHEMLFGFASAVLAGFLLTAVRNWTGFNTPIGKPLAGLVGLWLLGRILPWGEAFLPNVLIALVDSAFLPVLIMAITPPLMRAEMKVNRIFIPVLCVMAIANVLVHLEVLGATTTAHSGFVLGINTLALIVILITGRVMPFFTRAVIPEAQIQRWESLEKSALVLYVLFTLAQLIAPNSLAVVLLAAIQIPVHLIRVYGWFDHRVLKHPMLWVLYAGYLWLIVGLLLTALGDVVASSFALHSYAVGLFGVVIFGMICRVSLGHTGQMMQSNRLLSSCFILLNLAAVARVFLPLISSSLYLPAVHLSGTLWIISFLCFLMQFTPLLIHRRADGQAG